MEDIRRALMTGSGNKLSKKSYKFAVEIEKSRLFNQLIFLTFVSFIVASVFFLSLYFDISNWSDSSPIAIIISFKRESVVDWQAERISFWEWTQQSMHQWYPLV